jgi:hypothetical protein
VTEQEKIARIYVARKAFELAAKQLRKQYRTQMTRLWNAIEERTLSEVRKGLQSQ